MQILGIALILMTCTLIGYAFERNEYRRVKEYEQLIYGFEILKSEIDYSLSPLSEACLTASKLTQDGVQQIFIRFNYHLTKREETDTKRMWEKSIDESRQYLSLKEEDYTMLSMFGNIAGYLDKELQKRNIEMLLEKLVIQKKEITSNYNRTSKMYKGLGILIGLSVSIILL
ncbi:hypothetical protein AN639_00820 [Candidatus Epulonipiscium fishelsonii]|uniref:Uncharacterized protein n=1 Tax=Candidatus Epulonipiscium fishelsonii TaxID=77094 RepID=A0ACC8X7A7_9FIRM|nr:hypothetical protein AN396_12335 [Epulopiscium sp. SCG-B11WGA-EpuloA1]ONI41340.1 hypothetical protein AN639_00820 [Epulopiscium sp. SCG-B05WGA-EpuloA1]